MQSDIYRFSPITTESEIDTVLEYLVGELEQMSVKLLNQKLPINTLKIFAHCPEEYEFLLNFVKGLGEPAPFNSDSSYYAQVKRQIKGHNIEYIGVRVVDPYRLHVGCGDYEIPNFQEIVEQYAGKSDYIKAFREDMIELWHPDFDVLGYVVPPLN
jgi:hypothetical protein